MSAVTLRQLSGGAPLPVIRGAITMPRVGAWHANLHVASPSVKPSGAVEIACGPLVLRGTINRAGGIDAGRLRVRVVAGADGLRRLAAPKHYTSPIVRLPFEDLCKGAGEAVSATADATVLGKTLLAWTTVGIETGGMLSALVETVSTFKEFATVQLGWRLLADGAVWLGRETWPASPLKDYRVVENSPEDALLVLGVALPELVPGTTVEGLRADGVEHLITPEEVRTKVWVAG